MGNNINSFSFFKNYYDVIKELPKDKQQEILIAMLKYVFEDETPKFQGLLNGIWMLIERPLEISKIKSKSKQNQIKIKTESKQNQNDITVLFHEREREREIEKEREDNIYNNTPTCEELNNTLSSNKAKMTNVDNSEKKQYAEFVNLTNAEYSTLIDKYGELFTRKCIEILDNYKGSSGKKYKSDYRAILNWVVKRVEEENKDNTREQRQFSNLDELFL